MRETKFTGAEKLFTAVLRLLFLPNFESRILIRDHASKQPFRFLLVAAGNGAQ